MAAVSETPAQRISQSGANPKKRGISRAWLYEQLADIHSNGLDAFEAAELAQPLYGKRLDQLDLIAGLISVEGLQAADVARVLAFRANYLRYVVDTAADPATPRPKTLRVPCALVRPLLDRAEREHDGTTGFNRLLAEQTEIPLYTVRRIRSGARRQLTADEAELLLTAAGFDDAYRDHVYPLEDEHDEAEAPTARECELLSEELRPVLRILAAASLRGDGDWSDDERQALGDWRWMHGADWPEEVVPLFTRPHDRDQILIAHFRREIGRDPAPLLERVRRQALSVVRARQKREREALAAAEKAIGDYPIDATRVGELNRGAKRAGFLSDGSKPNGYHHEPPTAPNDG